jgi:alkylation response protein AidB-like acyl-CoA dehydrogenase
LEAAGVSGPGDTPAIWSVRRPKCNLFQPAVIPALERRGEGTAMEIGYTEEQQDLRRELRDYYTNLLTPEVEEELSESHGIGAAPRRITKQMATDGWLGIGWPKQWGGQGRSAVEQFIFFDESMRSGAPVPMLTINTVGPTIMNYGSDEQKQFFLPKILAGEIHFCIGYTEPNAGTDLAALQTKAVVDGDELVINGAKIFTSLAGDADYCWLAVRTDPEASKHKGISMVIVPMDTPGVRVVPMQLLGDHDINYTFWEDVRVPVTNIVGGINNGWSLITNQLNHERVTLCSPGIIERALGDVRAWAQETKLPDGRRVIDQEWVQLHLARVYAKLEFLKLINWKVAWQGTQGRLDVADASSIKVFGTEFYMEALRTLSEVLGQAGYLRRGSSGALLKGRLEAYSRSLIILTFGGGTNEIQRDLIAIFGLGMPRSLR